MAAGPSCCGRWPVNPVPIPYHRAPVHYLVADAGLQVHVETEILVRLRQLHVGLAGPNWCHHGAAPPEGQQEAQAVVRSRHVTARRWAAPLPQRHLVYRQTATRLAVSGPTARRPWVDPGWLLLKDHRRPADSLRLEGDGHLDAVGDSDEGNAAVHAVFLTVEGHCAVNLARAGSLAGHRKC
jgi:hypothetical protein